jgi:hypothetical protein
MWAEGDVELTCRGGVGTSCFKSIPVVPAHAGNGGEGGGVGSVKELEEWVRRRGGNLPTWCRLYTHICPAPPPPPPPTPPPAGPPGTPPARQQRNGSGA